LPPSRAWARRFDRNAPPQLADGLDVVIGIENTSLAGERGSAAPTGGLAIPPSLSGSPNRPRPQWEKPEPDRRACAVRWWPTVPLPF